MRARLFLAAPLLALGACGGGEAPQRPPSAPPDLETAAIERGLIPDPDEIDPTGLYARDTDRLCIVPDGGDYRIGVSVDYGESILCSGSGSADRDGETLRIALGEGGCRFEARFDGRAIRFPGRLPAECELLCDARASLTGLEVIRLSESVAEARALRDPRGRLLCDD